MGCKKCAEGVCGCSTMNGEQADEWWPSLVISIDTSGSTMEGNVNFKYKKIAMRTINDLKPPNVIIFDHNGNVQKVFEGSADDALNFLKDSTNLRPRNGTARMKDVMDAVMGINGHKLILTDGMESRTKNAEEPAVQEPDFIPNGDGRVIGQQDFAINLTPLHAEDDEGRHICDECGKVADYNVQDVEYRWNLDEGEFTGKGESRHHIGDINEFYCEDCYYKSGYRAETTGSPSPTFNEGITGQDGPSENPTNQVFNAMRTLAPSTRDVDSARTMLRNSGYGEVIYDRYIVNQQGSSNKFYYTAITEKDGKYYPMGAYGRIGYLGRLFNVAGKTERPMAHFGSMEEAYRQIRGKEVSKINARKPEKRYVDYTLRRGAESLSEIEGPTAEATTGGLHSPSSFDMTWEDGTGQSSASIPPNEIAWADTKGIPLWIKVGIGAAVVFAGKKLVSSRSSAQKAENNLKSPVKSRKSCCGGKRADTVRKDSEFSVGQINPVEVEGQSDVYGAEELHSPQTSAKVSQPNWGPQTTYLQNQRSTQKMW